LSAGVAAGSQEIAHLAELVRGASSVVALTGAGISVPSGIPDFRGRAGTKKGLWENVDPMEVAHIDAFHSDPVRFWHFRCTAASPAARASAVVPGPSRSKKCAVVRSARPMACRVVSSAPAR